MRFFIFITLLLTLSFPVLAEEKEERSVEDIIEEAVEEEKPLADPVSRYAPEHCDFEITFPEEPYTAKRCPQGAKKCYNMTSYSMVYNSGTTVDINVTCVPSKPNNYSRYNERVIKSALNGMVGRSQVTEFTINTEELEDIRRGSLIGETKIGNQERIYNAQLWVGQNSVMTIEAKLIGRANDEADTTFTDILNSIKQKELEEIEPSSGEEKTEKKD